MAQSIANRAFFQTGVGKNKVEIKEKPVSLDELDNKVLIKVQTWAINPSDHMLQDRDMVNYPLVLGCDVAGTVEHVPLGSAAASKFRIGDRVFGITANNGFQDYVALEDKLVAHIPSRFSFSDASVLGLGAATSAMFLFGADYLGLNFPMLGATKTGKSVLIWGGSSAVGSNAIQLVVGAGYTAITTCSKRNFDYVKSLGITQAFDYNESGVTEKLAAELDKGECAGIFMAAGLDDGNLAACKVAVASKQKLKFASSNYITNMDGRLQGDYDVMQPTPDKIKPFPVVWLETIDATLGKYLPEALEKGVYKIAPSPLVVNKKGLKGVQEGINLARLISEGGRQSIKETISHIKGGLQGGQGGDVPALKVVVERAYI